MLFSYHPRNRRAGCHPRHPAAFRIRSHSLLHVSHPFCVLVEPPKQVPRFVPPSKLSNPNVTTALPPKRPNRASIKPCTQDEVTSTVLPPMIARSGQYRLQGLIGSPRSSLSHVSQRLGCAVDAMQTALTRHIRGAPKNGYCTQHNHFPHLTCLRRGKGRHVSLSQTCQRS